MYDIVRPMYSLFLDQLRTDFTTAEQNFEKALELLLGIEDFPLHDNKDFENLRTEYLDLLKCNGKKEKLKETRRIFNVCLCF